MASPGSTVNEVPADVVAAALRAAENLGRDVADVPLIAIAQEAGMSRSTLVRRLNGSRQPLGDAVGAAGVGPHVPAAVDARTRRRGAAAGRSRGEARGARPPVRERAVDAAASLISERGLAAANLES